MRGAGSVRRVWLDRAHVYALTAFLVAGELTGAWFRDGRLALSSGFLALVAVPMLAVSSRAAARIRPRATLVWIGAGLVIGCAVGTLNHLLPSLP